MSRRNLPTFSDGYQELIAAIVGRAIRDAEGECTPKARHGFLYIYAE
jgi:hypothetical protein